MLLVIGLLDGAAAVGFIDGALHGVGHFVGVKNGAAVQVAGAAADGLNERAGGAQKPFLVGVKNGHQRDLGQIQAFAQQVDADQHVEFALAQVAQQS